MRPFQKHCDMRSFAVELTASMLLPIANLKLLQKSAAHLPIVEQKYYTIVKVSALAACPLQNGCEDPFVGFQSFLLIRFAIIICAFKNSWLSGSGH